MLLLQALPTIIAALAKFPIRIHRFREIPLSIRPIGPRGLHGFKVWVRVSSISQKLVYM